jgi:outer membrane protein assembly factor BamA
MSDFVKYIAGVIFLLFVSLSFKIQAQQIDEILISGNKTTQKQVIFNELCFSAGEYIEAGNISKALECSRNNLMNTSLFVYVNMDYSLRNDKIIVSIDLKERWYYWVYPILEHADRNFSAFLYNADWKKINYGLSFEKHNLFGLNHFLKMKVRLGYRQQIGFLYENPSLKTDGTMGFQVFADRFRQRQLAVTNENDQQVYYYQSNNISLKEDRAGVVWISRPQQRQWMRLIGSWHKYVMSDDLFESHPDYLPNTANEVSFLNVSLQYEIDNRDKRFFPKSGFYGLAEISKQGIGLLENAPNLLQFDLKLEYHLPLAEKWIYDVGIAGRWDIMNQNNIPYFMSEIFGYDYYPRGYEHFVVHGAAGAGMNQNIRFQILSSEIKKLKNMPITEFDEYYFDLFAYAFFDLAKSYSAITYGSDNALENAFLYSSGLGLECQTFYDRRFGVHLAFTNRKGFGIFAWIRSPLYKNY